MKISIRKARPDDAMLIARVVAMAIGYEGAREYAGDEVIKCLSEVAGREDTQYSYRNALIAELTEDGDGNNNPGGGKAAKAVGAVVGYDGRSLERLREGSLSVIRKYHPDIKITDDETDASEYYLDSLGVLPEYRGHGIARRLIAAIEERARESGQRRLGLLVDFDNADAERLYRSLGFQDAGTRPFFGHEMKHLVKPL